LKNIPIRKILPPLILAFVMMLIYLGTIAPGLTWANDGADGGDLITATATNGIPHPTGYPVYILVARLFQYLPLGSLAFRTNLLSAVAAVAACVLVYGILVWIPSSPVSGNWLAGMIAAFSFGISPVIWSQAVITEVYTLHAALIAGSVFAFVWVGLPPQQAKLDRWRGLVLGIALGNHLTSVLLYPAAILSSIFDVGWQIKWRSLIRILAWLGAGLCVYLILPIRSFSSPPVNWGQPTTLRQFIWLVTGELYQRRLLDFSTTGIWERIQAWVSIIVTQFELPGLTLALIGLIYFFKPTKLYFITLWNSIVFSLFAIFYSSFDSYLYLIPVFLSFSIWIGLGIGGLLTGKFFQNRIIISASVVLFSFLFIALTISRWPQVDAVHDDRAERFGLKAMAEIPSKAIVFASGDRAIFTLWYYHYALGQRPDITVAATDLLHFSWYDNTLRSTYPLISWPNDLLWPETITAANPLRPICTISYFEQEKFDCR
jgi:hypothetical protein